MRLSLGRIESEYILRDLASSCPALNIRCGADFAEIPSRTYEFRGRFIVGTDSVPLGFDGLECRVSFSYRGQCFYFLSRVRADAGGTFRFSVPHDLFRDEKAGVCHESCMMSFYLGSVAVRALSIDGLPLDAVSVPPDFKESCAELISSIAGPAGIPLDSDVLLYRLYESLERIRRNELNEGLRGGGCVLFADHRRALLLVPISSKPTASDACSIDMRFPSRSIRASATLTGFLRLNQSSSIICLALSDVQEEDRRFLYENLYGGLYH